MGGDKDRFGGLNDDGLAFQLSSEALQFDILGDDQVTKCICQTICSGTNWQYVGTVRRVVGGQNHEMVTGCQWGLNGEMVGLIGSILLNPTHAEGETASSRDLPGRRVILLSQVNKCNPTHI